MTEPQDLAKAVAALAATVDGLRTKLDAVAEQAERVKGLGGAVADLRADLRRIEVSVGTVAEFRERLDELIERVEAGDTGGSGEPGDEPDARSWFDITDPAVLEVILAELIEWVNAVLRFYVPALLPDCWTHHPEIIDAIRALRGRWVAAYRAPRPKEGADAEWHDRWLSGFVISLRGRDAKCNSLHDHKPGGTRSSAMTRILEVHEAARQEVPAFVTWWLASQAGDPAAGPEPGVPAGQGY